MLFSALIQRTEADLDGHSTRYFRTLESDHWELGLRPKDRRMARVLEHLVVMGQGEQIDTVRLREPSGDSTELSFDYQREASSNSGAAQLNELGAAVEPGYYRCRIFCFCCVSPYAGFVL